MNTIIVNEKDLDYEKYVGCSAVPIFEEFKLVVRNEEVTTKMKVRKYKDLGWLIDYNALDLDLRFGIRIPKDINEIYPEEGRISISETREGDILIGHFFFPAQKEAPWLLENLYKPEVYEFLLKIFTCLCNVMVVITLMGEERARKKVRKNNAAPSETKSNSKGSSLKKKVYLLDDIVEYVSEQYIENHGHHTINCPCWEVRGHYRHYKSGKTIFVPSYKKGKEKDTATPEPRQYYI